MLSNRHQFQSIVFDLDGTLINTAPDVRLALNHMLNRYGQPGIRLEQLYTLIGSGARSMVKNALHNHEVMLSEDEIDKAVQCYLDFYRAHPVVETTIYPGVISTLAQLKADGIQMGICTNKPAVMTHIVLEALGLCEYFSAVVAGDEVAKPKPHHLHLFTVLQRMQMSEQYSILVGDSEIDQQCAENARIPFVGVRYGYHLAQPTTHMIDQFSDLPEILTTIPSTGLLTL